MQGVTHLQHGKVEGGDMSKGEVWVILQPAFLLVPEGEEGADDLVKLLPSSVGQEQ